MKEKPYFSLFASAIRSKYYEDAYNSVADNNDIPFEMVFVGNVPPTKTMPDNFRYIYSDTSPANCWDIAARASEAELLILTADDLRYSKNFLNRAYHYTNIFDLDKVLIMFRFYVQLGKGEKYVGVDGAGFFDLKNQFSPAIGANELFRKDLYIKTGGFDKRFYGGFSDIDLTLRFYYELEMSSFLTPDCILFEVCRSLDNTALLQRSNPRKLLNSLWYKNEIISRKRLSPVESF